MTNNPLTNIKYIKRQMFLKIKWRQDMWGNKNAMEQLDIYIHITLCPDRIHADLCNSLNDKLCIN